MPSETPRTLSARHILTTDGWRRDATLHIANGRITAITDGLTADTVYDCLLPGMPNAHSHAFQRAMAGLTERRSAASDDSFWTWREWMYRFLDRITPEDNLAITRHLYIELLKAGYTHIGEFHYLHQQPDGSRYENPAEMAETILQASAETGIGLTLLPVLYATSDFGGLPATHGQRRFLHSTDDFLSLLQQLRPLCDAQDVSLGIAPHSLRAVTPEMLSILLQALPSLGLADCPKHIHAAEQVKEVEASLAYSGQRPVEWLLDHAAVNEQWCLIHSTHLTAQETERLARSGAVAGLCPTTEGNLGDGIFSGTAYFAAGGRIAIGTDSHIAINPAEELRLFEYTQRLSHRGRALLLEEGKSCGRTLWDKAVAGGRQALSISGRGLEIGGAADFLSLVMSHPLFTGKEADAILDTGIFALPALPVEDVFVQGKRVVQQGIHAQEAQAAADFRKVLSRLTA